MSIVKQQADKCSAKHESGGGTCKTITMGGVDLKVCLDGNGDPLETNDFEKALKKYAEITGQ